MRIKVDASVLREIRWYQYAIRFIFGGLITAIAGLIAEHYGPVIGGLFLAFPAIFPAGATLIEKHEKEKKREHGFDGTVRASQAVSIDAAGAAIGTLSLAIFALVAWKLIPIRSAWLALTIAGLVWLGASALFWELRKRV
ncbi:MAG: DUF3147 family protein [Candidatus Sulfotelmatobacter sp.]